MTPTRDELLKLAKQSDARTINDVNMEMLVGDIAFDLNSLSAFSALLLSAHQAQAEPEAITATYPNGVVDLHWEEGCIDSDWAEMRGGEPIIRDLYAAPPSSDQTWNEAIAAAAKICSHPNAGLVEPDGGSPTPAEMIANIAEQIRNLARPSQAQEPSRTECPECGPGYRHALDCTEGVGGSLNWHGMSELQWLECPVSVAYLSPEHAAACKWAATEIKRLSGKLVSGAVDELRTLHVGDSRFEGWCSEYSSAGKGAKQQMRDAYAAGMKDPLVCELLSRAQQAPAVSAPKRMTIEQSREYLVQFMQRHFTDKTFHRYIRGERSENSLAGDFAWQMARALLSQPAAAPVSEQTHD